MKQVAMFVLIFTLMFSVVGCNNTEDTSKVIAEYKSGTITQGEFDTYLNIIQLLNPQMVEIVKDPENKKQVVEDLIVQEYFAKTQTLTKEEEEQAKKELESYKSSEIQNQGEAAFKKQLSDLGLTDDDLANLIKRNLARDKYLEQKSDSTKMESVFNKNKNEFTVATVSHILVDNTQREDKEAKKRADEVLGKLKSGGDFAALAKEFSDDPGSKEKGGTYENMPVYNWVPEFKAAIINQKVGELSQSPVKTDYGYHIIKVISKKTPDFKDLSEEAKTMLKNLTKEDVYKDFTTKELPSIITKIDVPKADTSK